MLEKLASKRAVIMRKVALLPASAMAFAVATSANAPVMTATWDTFRDSMTSFFETGLGGPGMEAIGIAIAVIGVTASIISFVVHKFNPQSRMPGWITCLVIGLFGAVAMGGIGKPLELLQSARDLLYSWMGM